MSINIRELGSHKLVKVTAVLTISSILTRLISMVFFIILARMTSVEDYGVFRFLMTISFMWALFFTSIPTALTRYVGRYKDDKGAVAEYLYNSIILMLPIFLILSIIIAFVEVHNVYLILLLFAALVDFLYLGYVRGLLNYVKMAGYKMLENIIQLVLLVISYIIFKKIDLTWAIIFFSISGVLSLVIFEIFQKEFLIKARLSIKKIKELVNFSIPAAIGGVGWTVMFGINSIFINYFYGKQQVGYFSAGETLVMIFSFLPGAISTIMMPKAAHLKDRSRILKPLLYTTIGCLLISALMLIPFLAFKTTIIDIIFTQKYLNTASILLPLAIGNIMIAIFQIYASIFQGFNHPKIPTITITIACILNIIGSYFLTKTYGIVGSAISNAITATIALALTMIIFYSQWKTLSKN